MALFHLYFMDVFLGLEFLAVKLRLVLLSMIIFVALQERDSMETVNQLEVVLGEIDAMSTGIRLAKYATNFLSSL